MRKILIFILLSLSLNVISQSDGPNNGATFANVALAGSSDSWNNPSNVASSGNSYADADLTANGQYTDYLQVTNFGMSIPAGATIDGITVEIERWNDDTKNAKDNAVRIVKGGVIGATDRSGVGNYSGSDTDTYTSYGGVADLWGEAWTVADVNASNFGIAISSKRSGGGGGNSGPQIDNIRITVSYSMPLPIELLEFNISSKDGVVYITWITATETNNDYFILEKSKDGINFETVYTESGVGNSTEKQYYNGIDINPYNGISYYRLTQVDYDGKSETFKSKAVIIEDDSKKKRIVKIININGSEVLESYKGVKIYIFDDGTAEKRF